MTDVPPSGPPTAPLSSAPLSSAPLSSAPLSSAPLSSEVRVRVLAIRDEVGKVVVGQDGVVSGLVAALLVQGHVLLEGVPGVAKTLLAKTLAAALDVRFTRVQFTPDLMPSDVIGQTIYEQNTGTFRFREGPLFTNLLLADEINRTPPKTQAALLEAMEERQVTTDGSTRPLPAPFLVIATQNPIEYEGTYPLPEAQLDRFLFKLVVPYPSVDEEVQILTRHASGLSVNDPRAAGVRAAASPADLAAARREVAQVAVDPALLAYIVALARATRDSPSLVLGVSPRGATMLLHAARAWAWMSGRRFVTPDEVKAVARPCWRHRVQLRPELELEGSTVDSVLDGVLTSVASPR
jgi:MoxR-like ATPase